MNPASLPKETRARVSADLARALHLINLALQTKAYPAATTIEMLEQQMNLACIVLALSEGWPMPGASR